MSLLIIPQKCIDTSLQSSSDTLSLGPSTFQNLNSDGHSFYKGREVEVEKSMMPVCLQIVQGSVRNKCAGKAMDGFVEGWILYHCLFGKGKVLSSSSLDHSRDRCWSFLHSPLLQNEWSAKFSCFKLIVA